MADAKPTAISTTTYHDTSDSSDAHAYGDDTRPDTLARTPSAPFDDSLPERQYRVYKRRFLGLAQITLLNIIVSWNWLTFAPVSKTSSQYFNVSESGINWLSTGFLFAFVVASPAAVYTLNRSVKTAMITAACLMIVGSWIRYAGGRAGGGGDGTFGVVLFGQMIIGLAQPFVLAAPTRFSDQWFMETGRISATAVASLGNPFGGALGQLIDPFWADKPGEIPNMVLYVAILVCLPFPFCNPHSNHSHLTPDHTHLPPHLPPALRTTHSTHGNRWPQLQNPHQPHHAPPPLHEPLLSPPLPPLHHLRLRLQRHLLPPQPGTRTVRLHRRRSRHRRRSTHRHRPYCCRNLQSAL